MKIIVDESPVGVGKTHRAIEIMTSIRGRYVFATETLDMMNEIGSRIFKSALAGSGPIPVIEKVYHGNDRHGSVARQIADLPQTLAPHDHVIALVSHEGMMSSDFFGFDGWTLIVDEVPSMFTMTKLSTPTDVAFFEENYTLSPVVGVGGDNWRTVGLTARGALLPASSIAGCDGHSYLHHFHRRCRDPRRGPVVNLDAWSDMAESGREWVWWSLFHPDQISAFGARYFLGSGFTKSLSFKLFNEDRVQWETICDMGTRPLRNRQVRIVYYSDRQTSLSYFGSDEGQDDLAKIGEHIASTTKGEYFWSANGSIKGALEKHLAPSSYHRPRQAGTSLLMNYDTAAMFYAAKPSREVEQAIRGLGCDESDWVATNEYEAVLQFVTRTSVRDVTSTRDVVLHVFNSDQARYLKTFFDAQPHITSTLEKVDLELSTQTKKAPGRKPLVLTEAERTAKMLAQREKRAKAMAEKRKRLREMAN